MGVALAQEVVDAYLNATFTNEERHVRRLNKVKAIESKYTGQGSLREQKYERIASNDH